MTLSRGYLGDQSSDFVVKIGCYELVVISTTSFEVLGLRKECRIWAIRDLFQGFQELFGFRRNSFRHVKDFFKTGSDFFRPVENSLQLFRHD